MHEDPTKETADVTEATANRVPRSNGVTMTAKVLIHSVTPEIHDGKTATSQRVFMNAVTSKNFDANGENDDNSFARYTPAMAIEMTIQNPELIGRLKSGQMYYVDFREAGA